MRASQRQRWIALLLLAGCNGDCSCKRGCGEGGIDLASSGPAVQGTGAAADGARQAGEARPSAGGAAAPAPPGAPGPGATAAEPLEVLGELVDVAKLADSLPSSVGELKAPRAVAVGPAEHERRPISNVSRRYKHGERDLYVEIIDTAQAPELRANVMRMLADPSALQAPVREVFTLAGGTAVTTGFPAQRASGAIALVGGRYFLNAKLEGTDDMGEAARLLQGMDFSELAAKDEGGAGHGPR